MKTVTVWCILLLPYYDRFKKIEFIAFRGAFHFVHSGNNRDSEGRGNGGDIREGVPWAEDPCLDEEHKRLHGR